MDVGKLSGPSGIPHEVIKPGEKKPKDYPNAFSKANIANIEQSNAAYLREVLKSKNPLLKKHIDVYKNGKYPLNKEVSGFPLNIPPTRA